MYAAKEAGRNCWNFLNLSYWKKPLEDTKLLNGLRRALVKGELFLHYQPQLTIDGKGIAGI